MKSQEIELLKRIKNYLSPSITSNMVYITPAQQMRNAAAEIEEKERDVARLEQLIQDLSDKPKEEECKNGHMFEVGDPKCKACDYEYPPKQTQLPEMLDEEERNLNLIIRTINQLTAYLKERE